MPLFFINVPFDCSETELKEWIESRGIKIESIRIVRDLVSGVSPAFAYASLQDDSGLDSAISVLNGKQLRTQAVSVSRAVLQRLVA